MAIRGKTDVHINGPLSADRPLILAAAHPKGWMLAVKVLPTNEAALCQAAKAEMDAVVLLGLDKMFDAFLVSGFESQFKDSPFVPTKVIEVR